MNIIHLSPHAPPARSKFSEPSCGDCFCTDQSIHTHAEDWYLELREKFLNFIERLWCPNSFSLFQWYLWRDALQYSCKMGISLWLSPKIVGTFTMMLTSTLNEQLMGKLPTRSMFFVNNMRYLFLLPLILLAGCGQPKQEFWLTFQSVDPGLHRQVVITCYDKDCYIGREPNAPYTLGAEKQQRLFCTGTSEVSETK